MRRLFRSHRLLAANVCAGLRFSSTTTSTPTPPQQTQKTIESLPGFPDVKLPPSLFTEDEFNKLAELVFSEHYSNGEVETKEEGMVAAKSEVRWLVEWALVKFKETERPQAQDAVRQAVVKRIDKHVPLQYLLGTQPFLGLEVLCEPPVFIPRPETEHWVHWLIRSSLKKHRSHEIMIADLCTGTGCIGLALARYGPLWKVHMVEMGQRALQLAEKNKQHNKIQNATIHGGNMFHALVKAKVYGEFDIIVSNPPYITKSEYDALPRVVKHFEDPMSLMGVGGNDDGMLYYKEIAERAIHALKPEGKRVADIPGIVVEVGSQGEKFAQLLEDLKWRDVEIHLDMANKQRFVCAV
eukprot:PhF_6_TR37707/c0_g1_i1/m.56131/K02493/hemK, prmC, HEMK; release factor glutamine methyltransferase